MYWIDHATAVATEPTKGAVVSGTKTYFTEGNPGLGIPATIVTGDWLNSIANEGLNLASTAGLTPSKTDDTQWAAAVRLMAWQMPPVDIDDTDSPYDASGDLGKLVRADATSGAITIDLPALSAVTNGDMIAVTKTDSGSNAVTIDPSGSETVEPGAATAYELTTQHQIVVLVATTAGWLIYTSGGATAAVSGTSRGAIDGLIMANNGTDGDHDIDIAAGVCRNDDDDGDIALASALTKQFDTTFAEGTNQGGFVSGESLPTSGTVPVWAIAKDDGTADIFANDYATSAHAPTLPTGFTKKRRIGSLLTDGSDNIVAFLQVSDTFHVLQVNDYSSTSGRSMSLLTVSVPSGARFRPLFSINIQQNGGADGSVVDIMAPGDDTSLEVKVADSNLTSERMIVSFVGPYTNTSAQVGFEVSIGSGGLGTNQVDTAGWIDDRGRNA